jgi:Pvc16 N-terminal domain
VATYKAIAATSQAILGLLTSAAAAPGSEFADVQIKLSRGEDLQKPLTEGISLYLHRVVVSTEHRNRLPRRWPDGHVRKPAVPLDLHYLVNAWAPDAVKQQRLLGWCIRVLADTPTLPAGLLNHWGPEHDVFRQDETVEVLLEPLSTQDMSYVMEIGGASREVAATFIARVVELESLDLPPVGELVQTRDLRFDPAVAP